MLTAGIDSSMDSANEDNIQGLDINEDDIDDLEDDLYDDDEDIVIGPVEPIAPEFDLNVDNQGLPEETSDYIHTLEYQTKKLEQELEECDELLQYDVYDPRPKTSQSLVPYDDMKELEQLAAEQGLTVEEFKQHLLKQLDEDDFDEDEVEAGYDEIHLLQTELADSRNNVDQLVNVVDQEVKDFLEKREKQEPEKTLAIEGSEKISENSDKADDEHVPEQRLAVEDSNGIASVVKEVGPLVLASDLTDMRVYIQQQLKLTDENLEEREKRLKETMESQRHAEERRMLKDEQERQEFLQKFHEKEAMLLERKKEKELKMEEELKSKDGEMEEEYMNHQALIDKLVEEYEGEKHVYETTRQEIETRVVAKMRKAAVEIQRHYKGYRTRKKISNLIHELAERREVRQKEKYELRLMEVQYEINFKAEKEEKEKEEQKKKAEEDKKRKEEEEKQTELEKQKQIKAEELAKKNREEEELRKKQELEEEKQRQKALEEERKAEEKKKKEEEKLRKEEEKKRKEEEKKLKQEEEKRKKEEEKKKREDEKKKKEEEKKQRLIEESNQKEEEKRKENERKQREMEEKKEKKLHDDMKKTENTNNEFSNQEDKVTENLCLISTSDIASKKTEGEANEVISSPKEESASNITSKDEGSRLTNAPTIETEKCSQDSSIVQDSQSHVDSGLPSSVIKTTSLDPKTSRSSTEAKGSSYPPPSSVSAESLKKGELPAPHEFAVPVIVEAPKPDPIEVSRLDWIKHCLPWSKVSNEPWKLSQQPASKLVKRPSSAKKFPPVSEAVILAAAQAESLRQVSSVKLTDLPGCSLSTLSQCWSLRYLTVSDSNLVCLDGLSSCKHLMYINAESNKIEFLDLKDLGALQCVRLSNNCLTGTTGLDGCINLRWLDMSHNKLRRISGLGSLRRLHTFNLSHNQLTSCDGIEQAVTLQDVDLSHNFLQAFEKIDKLCLLTRLNLAANNVLQPPVLKNQVLLQWLDLTENSVQSLTKLSRFWLPLLRELQCGKNRLDQLDGLEKAVNLVSLDVRDNQISEIESLKVGLTTCQKLQHVKIQGNPVLDVYIEEIRDALKQAVPSLLYLDDESVSAKKQASKHQSDNEFLKTCQTQIKLHQKLREQFESQMNALLADNKTQDEDLCSVIFTFCDTSYKMTSEHRSAHEFGDVGVTQSLSDFKSPFPTNQSSDRTSSQKPGPMPEFTNVNNTKSLKDKFDSCLSPSSPSQSVNISRNNNQVMNDNFVSNASTSGRNLQADHSSHHIPSIPKNSQSARKSLTQNQVGSNSEKIVAVDSDSDEEDKGKYVDVTKDFEISEAEKKLAFSRVPHPPPSGPSYLNEKDKFLMALEGNSGESPKGYRSSPRSSRISTVNVNGMHANANSQALNGATDYSSSREKFNSSELQQEQISAKEKFNKLISGNETGSQSYGISSQKNKFDDMVGMVDKRNLLPSDSNGNVENSKFSSGITADQVGSHLAAFEREKSERGHLNEFGLDTSLDSEFDIDNMDFDLDKYLDMGELDEFLEKGWRPTDAPQIPQSNYPVLGKIQDAGHSISHRKPPMAPPPSNPQQAWRDTPKSEVRRPSQTPDRQPIPNPSPSPSSVASAAETLGGGSIKSKKEEIAEEWGFKDSRTAELMMARAKNMRHNAEKRRKLNKLDPHQRYQLFRKLEESGKIQHVKPPPAKVLPRKEYFQAREEEVQRQHVERHLEEKTRVNRTFEWLHTQVGDHPISTSRINPKPGPVYSNTDTDGASFNQPSDYSHIAHRKTKSPGSDHLDSASTMGGSSLRQARRYSVDEAFSSQSPMLPPIQINSAPSQQKNDRMSWRDTPIEKSGGWGGGKKRGSNK